MAGQTVCICLLQPDPGLALACLFLVIAYEQACLVGLAWPSTTQFIGTPQLSTVTCFIQNALHVPF